jgi:hypothetical protein
LRSLIAAQETPDEQAARADLTVEERRGQYGVHDPRLPKPWLEQYNEEGGFVEWEPALFDAAHQHGLDAGQVCGLRDAAIDLGQVVGDTGRRASEGEPEVRVRQVQGRALGARGAHEVVARGGGWRVRPTNAIVIVEDPIVPITMALARLWKKLHAEGVTRLSKNRHSRLYEFTPPGQARRAKSIMARRRERKGAHRRGLAELRRGATGEAPDELGAEGGGCRRPIYLAFFTRRGSPGGARSARSDEGSAEHAHVARLDRLGLDDRPRRRAAVVNRRISLAYRLLRPSSRGTSNGAPRCDLGGHGDVHGRASTR